MDFPDERIDLAASMNPSSFSTLKILQITLVVYDEFQDPLCGICDDFAAFSERNIIEEIIVEVIVQTDCQCKTDDAWRKLDEVLATGFPRLREVMLRIDICVSSTDGIALQEKLKKLPEEQFPLLSINSTVTFDFSVEIIIL